MRHESARLQKAADEFLYTNMGATAIGTGITAEPNYAKYCTEYLREISGVLRSPHRYRGDQASSQTARLVHHAR